MHFYLAVAVPILGLSTQENVFQNSTNPLTPAAAIVVRKWLLKKRFQIHWSQFGSLPISPVIAVRACFIWHFPVWCIQAKLNTFRIRVWRSCHFLLTKNHKHLHHWQQHPIKQIWNVWAEHGRQSSSDHRDIIWQLFQHNVVAVPPSFVSELVEQ